MPVAKFEPLHVTNCDDSNLLLDTEPNFVSEPSVPLKMFCDIGFRTCRVMGAKMKA